MWEELLQKNRKTMEAVLSFWLESCQAQMHVFKDFLFNVVDEWSE